MPIGYQQHKGATAIVPTLQAKTKHHALTSALALDVILTTQVSLTVLFIRLKVEPQSSATILWTSGSHFGRIGAKEDHTSDMSSAGIVTYLNNAVKVSRRALSVSARRERGRSFSRRVRISLRKGAMVVRRSCASF